MSLMPYGSSSSDLATSIALGALNQDKSEQSMKMQVSGLVGATTTTRLAESSAQITESFAREVEIIQAMPIADDVKSQLLMQAAATNASFKGVMTQIGTNVARLTR